MMKRAWRPLLSLLLLTLGLMDLVAPLGPLSLAAEAAEAPVSQQAQIEAILVSYYQGIGAGPQTADPPGRSEAPGPNPLSEADKDEFATSVLDEIALLPPAQFNDVFFHLFADYRQHPEHRDAIARLVRALGAEHTADPGADALRASLRDEIYRNQAVGAVTDVIDAALIAFSAAYVIQFGRGIWKGLATESLGHRKFMTLVRVTSFTMYKSRESRLVAAGISGAAGLVHTVSRFLDTQRMDPRHGLQNMQATVIREHAEEAVRMRDELAAIESEPVADFAARRSEHARRIGEIDSRLTFLTREMTYLKDAAPEFRSRLAPVAEDCLEIRSRLSRLRLRMTGNELRDALPLP